MFTIPMNVFHSSSCIELVYKVLLGKMTSREVATMIVDISEAAHEIDRQNRSKMPR